jgi:CheY-like chemotaxis protein
MRPTKRVRGHRLARGESAVHGEQRHGSAIADSGDGDGDRRAVGSGLMSAPRIVVADPNALRRRGQIAALAPFQPWIAEAESGRELLWLLADGTYDLAVARSDMPNVSGAQVVAMVRTAGLHMPFVLIGRAFSASVRRLAATVGAVALVEESTENASLLNASGIYLPRCREPSASSL